MARVSLALVAAVLLAAQAGCTGFKQRVARLVPPSGGYDDPTDDTSDPWISKAAQEGRNGYKQEKVNDPLGLRPYFMSQRARDIETNMGIVE